MTPTQTISLAFQAIKQASLVEQLKAFAAAHPEAITGAGIGAGVGGIGSLLGGAGLGGATLGALGGAGAGGLIGESMKSPSATTSLADAAPADGDPVVAKGTSPAVAELQRAQAAASPLAAIVALLGGAGGAVARDMHNQAARSITGAVSGAVSSLKANPTIRKALDVTKTVVDQLRGARNAAGRAIDVPFNDANAVGNAKSIELAQQLKSQQN